MNELRIRLAEVDDAGDLATLRYRFRAEAGKPVESEAAFVARTAPWIAERLGRQDWRAWVAVDGGAIVGHVFLHFIDKVPNPVPEAETLAYLTNFYVLPELRNRGAGARLLEAALAACEGVDVETVFLRPSKDSVPLYRRNGFVDAALLERPLAPHD
jgi:GNAT superfamily N-acetyltransferase